MKVTDLLIQLGNFMQNEYYSDTLYTWKYAYFMRDVLGYICGEKPKYNLYDYLDSEADTYWTDLQSGYCDVCWADVDKGPYGFQSSEHYAFLPCCSDFLSELARMLYGNSNISFQREIKKEIESLGFWNDKESPDLGDRLMDNRLIKAILSMCPDFFQFADKGKDNFRGLVRLFFDMVQIDDTEVGVGEWKMLNVESLALNAWLRFLYCDAVSGPDRLRSTQILTKLLDTPATLETQNDEIYLFSHESASPCFERPHGETECTPFSLVIMQNSFGNYNCGCEESFFWFGLLNPHFLAAMFDVKDFLEEMDEKYHYFLSNNYRTAVGGENMESYMDGLKVGGYDEKKSDESAIFL